MTTDKTKAALDAVIEWKQGVLDLKEYALRNNQTDTYNKAVKSISIYETIEHALQVAQAEAQPADAQRQEEKTCTCGAAGSGEGHTDWCDWLDVESPAVKQQPADDDVREAVDYFKAQFKNAEHDGAKVYPMRIDRVQTLIRAATAPKYTEEQWLKLFKTVAARTWTPEQALAHMKEDVSVCVATAPKQTDAEREDTSCVVQCGGTFCVRCISNSCSHVKAALRAPAAVPQEVVDILYQIRKSGFVSYDGEKPHVLAVKALALLGGKEG